MFPESIITVLAITIQQVENESVRSLLAASNEGRLGSKSDLLMLIKLVRQGCNQLISKNLVKITFSTVNMNDGAKFELKYAAVHSQICMCEVANSHVKLSANFVTS